MTDFMQVAELPISLRNQYLASLPEPQEWFLEERVRQGEVWVQPDAGYAVFHQGDLVEFFAVQSDAAHSLLAALVAQRPFDTALCKSFDAGLINAAQTLGWSLVETGFLFRTRTPVVLAGSGAFNLDKARSIDLPEIWNNGRDFYESADEVAQIFGAGGLWVASNGGQLVGSGVLIPIDASGGVVDIGMVTHPDQRNRGFGSLIVSGLADKLEVQGRRPICGCAQSNLASKAALEKAGFVSEHRLVRMHPPH